MAFSVLASVSAYYPLPRETAPHSHRSMCVIAWAWRAHPRYPLAVLANRDERHARPAEPAHWWTDAPAVLAGRDAEAGGTWMGVSRSGRFAAVTNRRGAKPSGAPSRGELTADFLRGTNSAAATARALAARANAYAGFNLLLGDGRTLEFVSNREPARGLEPGVHGMANGALDEALPKVARLTAELRRWIASAEDAPLDDWLRLLRDDTVPGHGDAAGAIFIRAVEYGSRASSVLVIGADGDVRFSERSFGPLGQECGTASFEFGLAS